MKKVRFFLAVGLINIIAIILAGFTYQFNTVLTAPPLLLQALMAVKYLTVLVILKPASINVAQLSLGFLVSDLVFALVPGIGYHSIAVIPLHIMMIQVLVILAGLLFETDFGAGLKPQKISLLINNFSLRLCK